MKKVEWFGADLETGGFAEEVDMDTDKMEFKDDLGKDMIVKEVFKMGSSREKLSQPFSLGGLLQQDCCLAAMIG